MPKLASRLKKAQEGKDQSLWEGPSSDGPNGGISQSMLSRFLTCRERFRIRYVLGLQPPDDFNKRMEYGSMWHCAEESLAAKHEDPWLLLDAYTRDLCAKYPLHQSDIIHWYNICKLQFPIYVKWWSQHEDVKNRTPLLQEETFDVPYKLPSGRTVRLRGKWDSVDLIGKKVWLQENKTKGDIDQQRMQTQLSFDLQTMMYLIALETDRQDCMGRLAAIEDISTPARSPIAGVRYNVIRRPLAGGKGSIRQKKNQSLEDYYKELKDVIQGAIGPEWGMQPGDHFFFQRWNVEVTPEDIDKFKAQFFNPILEQLCDWWGFMEDCDGDPWAQPYAPHGSPHYRMPYGVYSPLMDSRSGKTELDDYLEIGSTIGLQRSEKLFRELD